MCVVVVTLPGFPLRYGIRRCPPLRRQNDPGCPDSFLPAAGLQMQCPGDLGLWGTGNTEMMNPVNTLHQCLKYISATEKRQRQHKQGTEGQ